MFNKKMKPLLAGALAISIMATGLSGCGSPKVYSREERMEALDWTKSSAIYEVNLRQYTEEGTINAFSEHLDELKEMGIEILWLMPVHPISETKRSGVLGSYYSITDYKDINPEFGNKEDFKNFVDLAHEKGFHVMMDWVANHTGWDCEWIDKHPDWYTQDSEGNIIDPLNMGWPDVADLNYDNEDMRKEMISCMKYWVKEYDVDGFRCDYATGVPTDFWEEARTEIETVKPVYMLAEDGKTMSLLEQAFDFNYNWSLYDNLVQVSSGNKKADKLKMYIDVKYPEGTYPLNFIDNHDKNSYEGTVVENFAVEKLDAMWTLLYTIPGVPLVYSSDEISYDHAIAFMEKDTINWSKGERDEAKLLTKLSQIRNENKALYAGNYGGDIEWLETGNSNILAFKRSLDDNSVVCVFNLSKTEQEMKSDAVSNLVSADQSKVLICGGNGAETQMDTRALEQGELSNGSLMEPWGFMVLGQ